MDEQRIIELEVKISHQEHIIESLQTVVYEQQKTLERLEDGLKRLAQRFESALSGDEGVRPDHEKPPHY